MDNLRTIRACAALFVCAATAAACNESRLTPGFSNDIIPPTVSIAKSTGDTVDVINGIRFSVSAADNLGLKIVSIDMAGGLTLRLDTLFTSAVTSFTRPVDITLPTNTTAGGMMVINATVLDGADNPASARDSIFLFNSDALIVTIINPLTGAVAAAGKKLPIGVKASQRQGVRKVGYIIGPSLAGRDSIFLFTAPLPDTLSISDTLLIPDTAQTGSFTVTGFGEDNAGRRVTTPPLTVLIQSVANDTDPPKVTFKVAKRVEVDDSITVTATDPSGISLMGWIAHFLDGTVAGGDSSTFDGSSTQVSKTWVLGFNFSTLPQSVVISAFAVDAAGNRGVATQSSGSPVSMFLEGGVPTAPSSDALKPESPDTDIARGRAGGVR